MSSTAAPGLSESQTTPRSSSAVLPAPPESSNLPSASVATVADDDETTIPYTKKYHRIFKPRSYAYSEEEHKLIKSLSPLHGIPLCLFPTEEEPRPPLMHYGWLLPESVISGLLQRAEAKNELFYASIAVEPRVVRFVDEPMSMELVVDDMIKDLQLNIPLRQYINLVFTSTTESGYGICLTVYTNHVMGKLPTDKEIRTLAEHVGLAQLTPLWYPSAIRFEWEY